MRGNLWIAMAVSACLSACKSAEAPRRIGGDKDEHGCLLAAGYAWSELRRDCVRIFEEGVRADDPLLRPSLASYAVFAEDSSRAEVFRPSPYRNEILEREGDVWTGKTCTLRRKGNGWELGGR